MRSKLFLLIATLAIITIFPLVSAEIMFSQPQALYNINDVVDISATINSVSNYNGMLELNLVCNDETKNFYRSSISSIAGQEQTINNKFTLSKSFLGDMKGNCKILASYNSEESYSQEFKISDFVIITTDKDSISAKAGDNVVITGTATKENAQKLEGFVDASLIGTDIHLTRTVNNGNFEISFSFPTSIKAGSYSLNLNVYDKSEGMTANSAAKTITINLAQEPSKLDVAINKQSIFPGEELQFKPLVYDQANEEISNQVKVEIKNPIEEVIYSKLLKTGEEDSLNISNDALSGYWTIEASTDKLNGKRLFYVEELEKAGFSMANDTLIVQNVGNVPYKKSIQITIGDNVEVREMDIDVGKSKSLRLLAPEGRYQISVTDGTESFTINDIGLTGNVIGILDLNQQLGLFNRYPIVWLFLVVVFGLFIVMMVQRVSKRKFYGYPVERVERLTKKEVQSEIKSDNRQNEIKLITGNQITAAEHALVTDGRKEDASIVNLKIKNLSEIQRTKGNALESINNALESAKKHKGTVYQSGDNYTIVFSPSVTKTFKNDVPAVKTASSIAAMLNEHNKKYTQKIRFGIGVNSSEIASKLEQGKLRFTALGKGLNIAKKIADFANDNVLLSKEINNKVTAEVKTLKQGDFYSISRIVEREEHKDFINSFMKRNF